MRALVGFGVLLVWLVLFRMYIVNTLNGAAQSLVTIQKIYIPRLRDYQLPDVAGTLQGIVVPFQYDWGYRLNKFKDTLYATFLGVAAGLFGLTLLLGPLKLFNLMAIIIFLLTVVPAVNIYRVRKLLILTWDIVNNTVQMLEMDQSTLTQKDKDAITQMIAVVRDDTVWNKLTCGAIHKTK